MSVDDTIEKATEGTLAGEYATRLDPDIAGNPIYIGRALTGSLTSATVWQIRKLTFDVSGNLLSIQWPNGVADYTFVWDNRATYTYS